MFSVVAGMPALFQCLYYFLSEWGERQKSQLEMLHSKGDAHDGDAEQQTYHGMGEGHLEATKHNPKHIEKHRPEAHHSILIYHIMSERRERQQPQLKQLHAYGNTDDGDAIQKTQDEIESRHQQTAEYEPNEVS